MKVLPRYTLILVVITITTLFPCRAASPVSLGYFQEKLHVSTDKDDYIQGDTIRLRAHCVDAATHRPLCVSRYVYVELHDSDGNLARCIKLLARDSTYSGFMPTQSLGRTGEYLLVAYTLFMRNQGDTYFFKKAVSIDPSENLVKKSPQRQIADFDVAFFPEGGYLTDGVPCLVAFKALADDGLSVAVTGTIVDSRGVVVDSLHTLHAGMGCVTLTPQASEHYYALCSTPQGLTKRIALPVSENAACVLRVAQTESDFSVSVRSGQSLPQGLALAVVCRGQLSSCKAWNSAQSPLRFGRAALPGGVLQVLLLNKAGRVLSERLLFNRGAELSSTRIACANIPDARRKITLDVSVANPDGTPAAGDFSIAVTDRDAVPAPTSSSIGATLLLSSELRGNIESPDSYFDAVDTVAGAGLDALMLTQGWRRYDVPTVLRGEIAELQYPLEVGQEIAGTIRKSSLWSRGKRLENYQMQVLAPRFRFSQQVPIDAEGRFTLNGFDFPDSTLYVLRPAAVKGSMPKATVRVVPDSFPATTVLPRRALQPERETNIAQAYEYIERRRKSGMRNIRIDSVVIARHKPIEPEAPQHRLARHTWSADEIKEMGAYTIMELVMRMPGMTIQGDQVLYHGEPPVFMLDGMLDEFVGSEDPSASPKSVLGAQIVAGIGVVRKTALPVGTIPAYAREASLPMCVNWPIEWVSRIDLITGGNTVLWGPYASDGIISITTKTGAELDAATAKSQVVDITIATPLGFQLPAAFYAPAYPTEASRASEIPDYRTTLYWNPTVTLDTDGCAKIEFYTSDAPARYNIQIEGVTRLGKIIHSARAL